MDKVLKLAKELVAAIEEEGQKNKVMLKDIPAGGKFDTGIEDSLFWSRRRIAR